MDVLRLKIVPNVIATKYNNVPYWVINLPEAIQFQNQIDISPYAEIVTILVCLIVSDRITNVDWFFFVHRE